MYMAFCSLLPPGSQNIQSKLKKIEAYSGTIAEALFAGGCFWCIESAFEEKDGVVAAVSGYTGGEEQQANYEQVSSGSTKHYEAVLVVYDPEKVSYKELVDYFWKQIDPTDEYGQFADKGHQYRTALLYFSDEQKRIAETSKQELEASGKFSKPIATTILPATPFYPAEEYHQDYSKNNPIRYYAYRTGSGREGFLKETWGR